MCHFLYSHQSHVIVPVAPPPCQHFVSPVLLSYFDFKLQFPGAEHFFLCLFAYLPWESVCSYHWPIFFIGLFSYYWVWDFFTYSGYKCFARYVICKSFLSVCGLSFYVHRVFYRVFHFRRSLIYGLSLLRIVLLVSCIRSLCPTQTQKIFS